LPPPGEPLGFFGVLLRFHGVPDAPAEVFEREWLDQECAGSFFKCLWAEPRIALGGGSDRRGLYQVAGDVLQKLEIARLSAGHFHYGKLVSVVSQELKRPRMFGGSVYVEAQLVEVGLDSRALFRDGIDY
jgi:hypothetical protein